MRLTTTAFVDHRAQSGLDLTSTLNAGGWRILVPGVSSSCSCCCCSASTFTE
jgi:hypothetical protein